MDLQQKADKPQQTEEEEEQREANDYDTNLEDGVQRVEKYGESLADRYLHACRIIGTVPVQYFLRRLGQSSLNLNHYGLGPKGMKALAMVLQHDNTLTSLELESNRLGVEGTQYLVDMLQMNTKISYLNLSKNHLGVEGARIIADRLSNNYYVQSIRLSGNHFDDTAVKYIADALRGDFVIKELDLSDNTFSNSGGEYLGQMLDHNLGIEVLNLNWTELAMKGAVALCNSLKVNSTLKELLLESNGLSSFVADALGQTLKVNSTLAVLDLTTNLIDDQALSRLCTGLAVNGTLKILKLSENSISRDGALALLKMVKNNTSSALEYIDISTVVVCEVFVELLENIRRRTPALVVHYTVLPHIIKRLSAVSLFKEYLTEQRESLLESFRAEDKDGKMKISTASFRTILKSAEIPLDQNQIIWLMKKFDPQCTGTINYSQFINI